MRNVIGYGSVCTIVALFAVGLAWSDGCGHPRDDRQLASIPCDQGMTADGLVCDGENYVFPCEDGCAAIPNSVWNDDGGDCSVEDFFPLPDEVCYSTTKPPAPVCPPPQVPCPADDCAAPPLGSGGPRFASGEVQQVEYLVQIVASSANGKNTLWARLILGFEECPGMTMRGLETWVKLGGPTALAPDGKLTASAMATLWAAIKKFEAKYLAQVMCTGFVDSHRLFIKICGGSFLTLVGVAAWAGTAIGAAVLPNTVANLTGSGDMALYMINYILSKLPCTENCNDCYEQSQIGGSQFLPLEATCNSAEASCNPNLQELCDAFEQKVRTRLGICAAKPGGLATGAGGHPNIPNPPHTAGLYDVCKKG
jgi:hypothetical protein